MKRFWIAALPFGLAFLLAGGALAAPPNPTVIANANVDLDHGLSFSQNKQNEPSIARDPVTGALIAGANDELSQAACTGTTTPLASPCPFTPGAPISAYYTSSNGTSWGGGYLPGFATIGRASGGDPSLDVGPRRCAGGFSWSCGTVTYYGSLADPFPVFGGEQVTVSRSYDDGASWSAPVAATSTDNKSDFDDHSWIAVDRGASSPWFGRLYVFWADFCNTCSGNGHVKLYVAHSDDEGRTWAPAVQVSAANNNAAQGFRETGQMTVASDGTVEAFWTENADSKGKYPNLQVVALSKNGGATFSAPITIAGVTDYPLSGTPFDVVDLFNRVPGMSARVDCYPHPASDPASTNVYVVWCDFSGGVGTVKAAVSGDGVNWTQLGTIAQLPGRNAFFPAVDVSPTGLVAVAFDALTAPPAGDPWQTGVQVYDNYYVEKRVGAGSFTTPLKVSTASSNPEGSAYNNLQEQFIGDYIDVAAGPTISTVVWTDARNASLCAAVSAYQAAVYAGSKTAVAPNPDTACPTSFGNTDTYAGLVGQ
jgi:hypothetical protein